MASIFNSDINYQGEDIHIIRNGATFNLGYFFNVYSSSNQNGFDFEYLPQIWGTDVNWPGKTSTTPATNNPIPKHHLNSKTRNNIGSIGIENITINTITGDIIANVSTTYSVYNILVQVNAFTHVSSTDPNINTYAYASTFYIRVHFHVNIKYLTLSPGSYNNTNNKPKMTVPRGFGQYNFAVHAIFDDDVMGDISLMPYVNWSKGGVSNSNIHIDSKGKILIDAGCSITTSSTITTIIANIDSSYFSTNPSMHNEGELYVIDSWISPANNPKAVCVGPTQSTIEDAVNILILADGFDGTNSTDVTRVDQIVTEIANYFDNSQGLNYPWKSLKENLKIWYYLPAQASSMPGSIMQECVPVGGSLTSYNSKPIQAFIKDVDAYFAGNFTFYPPGSQTSVTKSIPSYPDFPPSLSTCRQGAIQQLLDTTVNPKVPINPGSKSWNLSQLIAIVGFPILADTSQSNMFSNKVNIWQKIYWSSISFETPPTLQSTSAITVNTVNVFYDVYKAWLMLAKRFIPSLADTPFAVSLGTKSKAIQTLDLDIYSVSDEVFANRNLKEDSITLQVDNNRMGLDKIPYLINKLVDKSNNNIGNKWYKYDGGVLKSAAVNPDISHFSLDVDRVVILSNLAYSLNREYFTKPNIHIYDQATNSASTEFIGGFIVSSVYDKAHIIPAGKWITSNYTNNDNAFELFHFNKNNNEYSNVLTSLQKSTFDAEINNRRGYKAVLLHELTHTFMIGDEYGGTDDLIIDIGDENVQRVDRSLNIMTKQALYNSTNLQYNIKRVKWRYLRIAEAGVLSSAISGTDPNYTIHLRKASTFVAGDNVFLRTPFATWKEVEAIQNQGKFINTSNNYNNYDYTYDLPKVSNNPNDQYALFFDNRNFSPICTVQSVTNGGKTIEITRDSSSSYNLPNNLFNNNFTKNSLLVKLVKLYPITNTSYFNFAELISKIVLDGMANNAPHVLFEQEFPASDSIPGKMQLPTSSSAPIPTSSSAIIDSLLSSLSQIKLNPKDYFKIVGLYAGGDNKYGNTVYHPTGFCYMRSSLQANIINANINPAIDVNTFFCPVCSYLLTTQIMPEKHKDIDIDYNTIYPV